MRTFHNTNNNFVEERNKKVLSIFNSNGMDLRFVGDDHSPMFILEDSYLLSCLIDNNRLHFRSSPYSEDMIHSVNLSEDCNLNKYELKELLERMEHLPVYKIQEKNTGLFLVGYDFLDTCTDERGEGFPVFGKYHPIVYVNQNMVYTRINQLEEQGYNIQVI